LSLNPNGSKDHEIKIKGLENVKVGDFSRIGLELENGLGSLIASDIKAVEELQVKLAARVAKSDDNLTDNEEEHEEVFTLGRIGT
jgi:hypothetical protein